MRKISLRKLQYPRKKKQTSEEYCPPGNQKIVQSKIQPKRTTKYFISWGTRKESFKNLYVRGGKYKRKKERMEERKKPHKMIQGPFIFLCIFPINQLISYAPQNVLYITSRLLELSMATLGINFWKGLKSFCFPDQGRVIASYRVCRLPFRGSRSRASPMGRPRYALSIRPSV